MENSYIYCKFSIVYHNWKLFSLKNYLNCITLLFNELSRTGRFQVTNFLFPCSGFLHYINLSIFLNYLFIQIKYAFLFVWKLLCLFDMFETSCGPQVLSVVSLGVTPGLPTIIIKNYQKWVPGCGFTHMLAVISIRLILNPYSFTTDTSKILL